MSKVFIVSFKAKQKMKKKFWLFYETNINKLAFNTAIVVTTNYSQ